MTNCVALRCFQVPGGQTFRMNDWARKQLASMLGLRWDTWFKSASGEERAEEVNRRFSRIPGERKLRSWRDRDEKADGIVRAFLAPSFTPIDDARIFERMNTMMRGLLDEYRFTSVTMTDSTTHYTAVHVEPFDLVLALAENEEMSLDDHERAEITDWIVGELPDGEGTGAEAELSKEEERDDLEA